MARTKKQPRSVRDMVAEIQAAIVYGANDDGSIPADVAKKIAKVASEIAERDDAIHEAFAIYATGSRT